MSVFELSWKWMSFLSFGFSLIAAVLAIDMYKLSRTGQFGASWRVLITATVIYALLQASHLAETVNIGFAKMSHVVELIFVLALAYSFYLQRQLFRNASNFRDGNERRERSNYSGPERRGNRNEPYQGPERRQRATDVPPFANMREESEADAPHSRRKIDVASDDIEWQAPDSAAP